ncbi:MAG: Rid family hydrolase [Hyphomicrobiaceae bacterium]
MAKRTFKRIHTTKAGVTNIPSTQGVVFDGMVHTSGVGPLKPGGHELETSSFRAQVELTINNLREILKAGGSDFSHCVRIMVLLADFELVQEFNEIYSELMPRPFPPRMCFIVDIVKKPVLIEMHAVGAVIDETEMIQAEGA